MRGHIGLTKEAILQHVREMDTPNLYYLAKQSDVKKYKKMTKLEIGICIFGGPRERKKIESKYSLLRRLIS